jgi:hypothetical protein
MAPTLVARKGYLVNSNRPDIPWIDASFLENQRIFPAVELLRYAGQHIAWSWDGSRILAGDPERRALDDKLRSAGIDLNRVVHDYVEHPDVSYMR